MADPVTKNEAKLWMRVDHTTDDPQITELIAAATEYAQNFTQLQAITATREEYFKSFAAEMPLPWWPLQSVSSITYVNTAGTTATVTSSIYGADTTAGVVRLEYGQTWPTTRGGPNDLITVTYLVGYATAFTAIAGTDICTAAGKVFVDTDRVRLYNSGGSTGALPAGLALTTDYYIRDYTTNTFKLALTSGGGVVDITGTGVGTHYVADEPPGIVPGRMRTAILMLAAHWYEHREAAVEGRVPVEVPLAVKNLLWQVRHLEMR